MTLKALLSLYCQYLKDCGPTMLCQAQQKEE